MTGPGAQRATAARLLTRVVVRGRTTDQAFAAADASPLTQELVLGSLRHYFSLAAAVDAALRHPLKPKDQDLKHLMIVGVYQLWHMRVPDHAAVHETVEACRELRKSWARGLVNAVLRRCAANSGPASPASEHPAWLEERLRRQYPDAPEIMAANNERAPMTLRINLARTTTAAYLERLAASAITSRPPHAAPVPGGIGFGGETRVLVEPIRAASLPGFAEGLVAVQDGGAQLAAPLLAPRPGDRIIDACAAPGGKLFHLLESQQDLDVVAVDREQERLDSLQSAAARLGHRPVCVLGDATTLDWWDGVPVQRVLLDAPCTGTGTLRRHPDIKLLRRASDLAAATRLQAALLANLWRALAPGGTLLYCTCSILAEENDGIVAEFLARQGDAVSNPFVLPTGRATRHGWQLLPTDPDTDGFYYSRMTKARA
jgi:16S rRNA (cytosine967-C5)-methyltransferase